MEPLIRVGWADGRVVRVVSVSFAAAAARLEELARGGVEYLLRVGPAGAAPGVSRLVRARRARAP